MTTAAQIQSYCLARQTDVSFDRRGVVRVLDAGELIRLENIAQLADMMGLAPATNAGFGVTLDATGYDSLADVLQRAFQQASAGKGRERHATELPFDQQPMQTLASLYGVGFLLGQAAKKAQESQRLPSGRDVAELLGAINYLAGAVIHLERSRQASNDNHASLMADIDRFTSTKNV